MSDAGRAAWRPRFEMSHRRLVPFDEALGCLTIPPGLEALYRRLLEDELGRGAGHCRVNLASDLGEAAADRLR